MASRSTIGGSCPLQFVVHPLPGSPEQLTDRLREVGDRLRLPLNARPGPIVPAISVIIPPVGSELGLYDRHFSAATLQFPPVQRERHSVR